MIQQAIIYVDDESVILLALRRELQRHFRGRYAIETALNAEEAETLIATLEIEGMDTILVISDWFMPGRRGDQFLIDLHRARPGIRSILVTGQADEAAIDRVRREAGLCACLRKPWKMSVMIEAIENCLALEANTGECYCEDPPA